MKQFEISLIKLALAQTGGHQARAAKLLNIKPTTLNTKIKQYGIEY
jgi:DNA-binding NtrC family response regulator